MSIARDRMQYLKALGLPSDAELIRRARNFLLESGLTQSEMAELMGIPIGTLRVWTSGSYGANVPHAQDNSLSIRAKVKDYLDQWDETHDDFLNRPHYQTSDFATIRASVLDAMENGVAYLVDGPPGTQKTHSFRRVAAEINDHAKGHAVYMRVRCEQAPSSFLVECCIRAGIPSRGNIDQMIRKLRFFLSGRRTVLIVDEAQALSKTGLEVLRQLLDEPPYFGVILGGSHNLSVTLQHWQMEQWRSRLRKTHLLTGPSHREAEDILLEQLGPMSRRDVDDTIDEAMTETMRDSKRVRYISARALFDAIRSAKAAMAAPAVEAAAQPELQEAGAA